MQVTLAENKQCSKINPAKQLHLYDICRLRTFLTGAQMSKMQKVRHRRWSKVHHTIASEADCREGYAHVKMQADNHKACCPASVFQDLLEDAQKGIVNALPEAHLWRTLLEPRRHLGNSCSATQKLTKSLCHALPIRNDAPPGIKWHVRKGDRAITNAAQDHFAFQMLQAGCALGPYCAPQISDKVIDLQVQTLYLAICVTMDYCQAPFEIHMKTSSSPACQAQTCSC